MSTSDASTSATAAETASPPSVFDFLYNDSRRVASYLSQFEGGHLTQLSRSDETGATTGERSGRQFGLGAPALFGGKSHSSESEGTSAKEGMVRTFDPYWTNARSFLEYLSQRDLIERDIFAARMGQFVLVKGKLAILDLSSMQSTWQIPMFKKLLSENLADADPAPAANRQQRRAQGKPSEIDPFASMPTVFRLAMEMFPGFPHSTVASIIGEYWSTWGTLAGEHLVGFTRYLILKHGSKIAGEWAMLGVLDAIPDEQQDDLDDTDKVLLGLTDHNIVAQAVVGLTPVIRMVAGRPPQSFGVTPLLIFREIAGRQDA